MTTIPSPYQYPRKLSHYDNNIYRAFEECKFPNAVNIIEEFGSMMYLMGKHIPSARPCCVNGFAVQTIKALRASDDFESFTEKMYKSFCNVLDNTAYYGPLYWIRPDDEDDEKKCESIKEECWNQTQGFLKAVWDQDYNRRESFGLV